MAEKLVDDIVSDDPRLRAARDTAARKQGRDGRFMSQSLKALRQRLKDKD